MFAIWIKGTPTQETILGRETQKTEGAFLRVGKRKASVIVNMGATGSFWFKMDRASEEGFGPGWSGPWTPSYRLPEASEEYLVLGDFELRIAREKPSEGPPATVIELDPADRRRMLDAVDRYWAGMPLPEGSCSKLPENPSNPVDEKNSSASDDR